MKAFEGGLLLLHLTIGMVTSVVLHTGGQFQLMLALSGLVPSLLWYFLSILPWNRRRIFPELMNWLMPLLYIGIVIISLVRQGDRTLMLVLWTLVLAARNLQELRMHLTHTTSIHNIAPFMLQTAVESAAVFLGLWGLMLLADQNMLRLPFALLLFLSLTILHMARRIFRDS